MQAIIIDDNNKNIAVLSRLLSNEGISSIQISNPERLDVASKQVDNICVIFLDIEMPGMNGYQILDKLKADVRFQYIPIIAYTVHVSEIKIAHEKGFDGFLGKPLDSDTFPGQLRRIMNGDAVWEIP